MESEISNLRKIASELIVSKDPSSLKNITSDGLLSILRLKAANKSLAHATEELKEETSKSKGSLEAADLHLQNLLYEKQYYEKEINACRSFQSAFSDAQIALLPESEFWSSADEDLQSKAKASGHDHELMLQRLAHEMRLRRKTATDLEALKAAKASRLQAIGNQEKILRQLGGSLKALEDTARPLQDILLGGPTIRSVAKSSAEFLPIPLYILYSQLAAAQDALGLHISVSITGQSEEAQVMLKSASFIGTSTSESSEKPIEHSLDVKKRKLPAAISTDDIYKTHPLNVDLEVYAAEPAFTTNASKGGSPQQRILLIRFQHLSSLKAVTACCLTSPVADDSSNAVGISPDNLLLASLFPHDDGSEAPSESMLQMENGAFKFDMSRPAKPYKWCQHLAGIDLVPSLPHYPSQLTQAQHQQLSEGLSAYRQQLRVVTVVSRLQAVKQAAAALNSLLLRLPKHPLPIDVSAYTRLPTSQVIVWEPVGGSGASAAAGEGLGAAGRALAAGVLASPQVKKKASIVFPASGQVDKKQGSGHEGLVGSKDEAGAGELKGNESVYGGEAGWEGRTDRQRFREAGDGEAPASSALIETEGEGHRTGVAEEGGLDEGEIPADIEMLEEEEDWMVEEDVSFSRHNLLPNRQPDVGSSEASDETKHGARVTPVYHLHRLLVRSGQLEVEAHVRVFTEYPLRPPLFNIMAIREQQSPEGAKDKGSGRSSKSQAGKGKVLEAVNEGLAMELQANIKGVTATPTAFKHETLLHQLTHFRLAFDAYVSHYLETHPLKGSSGTPNQGDISSQLLMRQQLRGRDRRLPNVVLK
ncbi:hypothetical protein CEUSTIGMA_g904.t1 [Chlamydomonas eustigma]|uniref:THO complex subunit 5 n=1 Tax=Chlamydomonas eustigma TaxID=1157962 RepID=A0A250WS06_9CHLO|nr:hypothetical protein CEUSTIGMA_g904.t1 [Chlamydomonas eustigma]|eukprot:GAX73452.1 hypothetical protein CEUSTIGMA_g904.t1 [Chlamydomonas eustigma]